MIRLQNCKQSSLQFNSNLMMQTSDYRYNISGGLTLPAGTNVVIVPSMVHRDPKHWEDPEVFRPERFLSSEGVNRHPYAYIPFSAGARNCIGTYFLSLILRNISCLIECPFCRPALRHNGREMCPVDYFAQVQDQVEVAHRSNACLRRVDHPTAVRQPPIV